MEFKKPPVRALLLFFLPLAGTLFVEEEGRRFRVEGGGDVGEGEEGMTVSRGSANVTVLTDAGVERQPREEERRPRGEDREGAAAPLDLTAGVGGRLPEEEEDDGAGAPSD